MIQLADSKGPDKTSLSDIPEHTFSHGAVHIVRGGGGGGGGRGPGIRRYRILGLCTLLTAFAVN